jgi:hypothetical protein
MLAVAAAFSLAPHAMAASSAPADVALAAYRAAIASVPDPGDMIFQYTESRTGPARAIDEVHRVYRGADGDERNEMISVDGSPVVPAIVRFSTRPTWPYDVRRFEVDEADYNVLALGYQTVAGKRAIAYSTVRTTTGDFSITALYLDPVRAMPVRETFAVAGGGCSGSGIIDFGFVDGRWLPTDVSANCSDAPGGASFKETIKFTQFVFPPSLPADVFQEPGA